MAALTDRTAQQHIWSCEVKSQPEDPPATTIVEAFGHRKCPKLVQQLMADDIQVRRNALDVVVELVKRPLDLVQALQAGLVRRLCTLLESRDDYCRRRAAASLRLVAASAPGRAGLLEAGAAALMVRSLEDEVDEVRSSTYNALRDFTHRAPRAVAALTAAGYPAFVCRKLNPGPTAEIDDGLYPTMLALLANMASTPEGLEECLASHAIDICVLLLAHPTVEIRVAAARTLGSICFADRAKITAIRTGAVPVLCGLLEDADPGVRAAVAGSLMAICVEDDGKRAVVDAEAVPLLMFRLRDKDRLVRLNVLKTLSSVVAYPPARTAMRESRSCNAALRSITLEPDALLARSAEILIGLIDWEP